MSLRNDNSCLKICTDSCKRDRQRKALAAAGRIAPSPLVTAQGAYHRLQAEKRRQQLEMGRKARRDAVKAGLPWEEEELNRQQKQQKEREKKRAAEAAERIKKAFGGMMKHRKKASEQRDPDSEKKRHEEIENVVRWVKEGNVVKRLRTMQSLREAQKGGKHT